MGNLEKGNSEEHRNDVIKIFINDEEREIHRGNCSIAEIKAVGGVPMNYMLEQLIDGRLTGLADDGFVVLKGDEIFIGHIKDGASS